MTPISFTPVLHIQDLRQALRDYSGFAQFVDFHGRSFLNLILLEKGNPRSEEDLLEDVRFLVESGTDLNAGEGRTEQLPLQAALCFHRLKIARFLLGQGANPNAKNRQAENAAFTAAFIAGRLNDMSIFTDVVDAGGDATALDKWGYSTLDRIMEPVLQGRESLSRPFKKIVKLLRDLGTPTPETEKFDIKEYHANRNTLGKLFGR